MELGEPCFSVPPSTSMVSCAGLCTGKFKSHQSEMVLLSYACIIQIAPTTMNVFVHEVSYEVSLKSFSEDQTIMMEIKKAVWDKAFFRSPHSISLTLTHLMFGLSDTVPFLFLHLKAIRMGFSLELSAMLISAIGFTSLVGRVGIGILTGNSRRRRFVSFITASIVCSASMAFYAFANSYLVFIIGSCLFGISTGMKNKYIKYVTQHNELSRLVKRSDIPFLQNK